MAENKKGFLLYADQREIFEQLPDELCGKLIKMVFSYVNDEDPKTEDKFLNLAFTLIKSQLKRDLKKYESKIDERSLSGRVGNLKRWHPDLYKIYESGTKDLISLEVIAKHRKSSLSDNSESLKSQTVANIADTDNDTVTDTDTVSVIETEKEKVKKEFMSKIKISDLAIFDSCYETYFEIAEAFRKLFLKNLKEKDSPTVHQDNAKFKSYVDPIRLMMENDKITKEQMQVVFRYLSSEEGEFWKSNILSTSKLREKFSKLIMNANEKKQSKPNKNWEFDAEKVYNGETANNIKFT